MRRILLIALLVAALRGNACAQAFSVFYDCSTPPALASPPWDVVGACNYQLNVASGILNMVDPDACSWVLLERADARVGQDGYVLIEANVKIPNGSGQNASPQIAFAGFDPALPYANRAHMWYAVDLYPDRIEFTKVDNDQPGKTIYGSHPVPDLGTTFHTIALQKHEASGVRNFVVAVDGVPVITVTNEIDPRPITSVDVGYGLETAVGNSYWDYIRYYWTDASTHAEPATWGGIKSLFR
jgi:hypothetical protein